MSGCSNLGVVLTGQVGASSVITLPFLGLLTARGVKQYLLEFLVAQLSLLAAGPGKPPATLMKRKRAIETEIE